MGARLGGRPTIDPAAGLAGALLPFGGYKGSGLALAIEVLTGVLAGGELGPELINASLTGSASSGSATRVGTVGSLYVAVDPEPFSGRDEFATRMAQLTELIKGTPPAPGFDEILIPGELEARAADAADARGIVLGASRVASLQELGAAEAVPFPGFHSGGRTEPGVAPESHRAGEIRRLRQPRASVRASTSRG